jgi:hypothetical protein
VIVDTSAIVRDEPEAALLARLVVESGPGG